MGVGVGVSVGVSVRVGEGVKVNVGTSVDVDVGMEVGDGAADAQAVIKTRTSKHDVTNCILPKTDFMVILLYLLCGKIAT
jgi:hypothetical protein